MSCLRRINFSSVKEKSLHPTMCDSNKDDYETAESTK